MSEPAVGDATRQLRKAIDDDYSQYVAVAPITDETGNARFYNVGDKVPATNVRLHRYDELGLVAKTSTKAAAAAVEASPADKK